LKEVGEAVHFVTDLRIIITHKFSFCIHNCHALSAHLPLLLAYICCLNNSSLKMVCPSTSLYQLNHNKIIKKGILHAMHHFLCSACVYKQCPNIGNLYSFSVASGLRLRLPIIVFSLGIDGLTLV
jgi:hypothetical protein